MLDNKNIIQPRDNGIDRPNNQPIYNGPWVVGNNCHIVIDGVGYIVANGPDYGQETMKSMGSEQTAPFFGDPVNYIDPQSSDMTMLLPIGQNDFTNGIGSLRLETDPKGYELCNNLQLTPQNTLFNGPAIFESAILDGAPNDTTRWWQEGYFTGITVSGTPIEYFAIGGHFYRLDSSLRQWHPLPARNAITNIFGYAGFVLVCYGDNGGDLFNPTDTPIAVNYLPFYGFTVGGDPYIIYKDGRIYSAFLHAPNEAPTITSEDGPDVSYMSWAYAVNYIITLPNGTKIQSGMGPPALVDKAANKELVITLPGIPWRGGMVGRQLYRSQNNGENLFRIADETVLGALRTQWVDTDTDTAIGGFPQWNWNQQNDTAMQILCGGNTPHNMWRSETLPIWMPEYVGVPNTGDKVWSTATFRDGSGNEAIIIGTTSGLFMWDGASATVGALRPINYDFFNCFSVAVNHGQVYYTSGNRSITHIWSPSGEAFLNGPWLTQFQRTDDVRLISCGEYVYVAASGISNYTGAERTSIYRYNGTIFDWQTNYETAGATYPYAILGRMVSEHSFAWYPNDTRPMTLKVSMDPKYQDPQLSDVLFRSSMSDCGLPRLRKQVFAVMVRYFQYTQQQGHTLNAAAEPGDTRIYVESTSGWNIGDWVGIDDSFPNFQEYRQIAGMGPDYIDLSHPLTNGALVYPHNGVSVIKCGVIATLRHIFTADNPTPRDIQVGGPFRNDYLFAYLHLPIPVYTFVDGIELDWLPNVLMELVGWSMLTALNPPYYGLQDLNIRIQDQVKLPNNMFHPYSSNDLINALRDAYNKGAVDVVDQFNNARKMRVQRLSIDYEEPKQRHPGEYQNQATAHIRLLDQDSELFKQENLVLGISTSQ